MDLNMRIMTGGLERTEGEWRGLLDAAGFKLTSVRHSSSPFDLLEAKPV
ncbi:MAG TPA: hypothetical protein VJP06_02505 [Thermoplasmata archaeon]|nr:hypothetical protein [Thermoplasmata archaeon]